MQHLLQFLPLAGGVLSLAAALTNLATALINRSAHRRPDGGV
ncbi:hypothetical protein [Micromonospora humida]|nr:hypothetical protein [Micromonospora humida]